MKFEIKPKKIKYYYEHGEKRIFTKTAWLPKTIAPENENGKRFFIWLSTYSLIQSRYFLKNRGYWCNLSYHLDHYKAANHQYYYDKGEIKPIRKEKEIITPSFIIQFLIYGLISLISVISIIVSL